MSSKPPCKVGAPLRIRSGSMEMSFSCKQENGVEIVEVDKTAFEAKTQPVVDDFLVKTSDGQKQLYDLLIATCEKY